ncbi:dinitrogenase iron-molybdenum cofactor [Vibrio sp. JC009]|uniref:NifB/NifX family molybdenum-iron cluster-binding protein n=1 Tax=Vibrio sp. JC009 TaxID=2912314 RepID=UPI0023AF2238|nr:NifB/NifX family molybdenum-iron cluster-binding protein [Vibrio sp. JC009]WED21328.1 dinitrogenase iron-molybdenum cofactor [Vibrio sp. JC009]
MIYAIPTNSDTVANHFMKASQFALVDENNAVIKCVESPAAGAKSSCADKSSAIKLLKEMKPDAVIVRNIGERSLGKLLSAGIRVMQVNTRTALASATQAELTELTEASQGRPSVNHEKKGGCSHSDGSSCGGCSCGDHDHDHDHNQGHGVMQADSGKKRAIRNLFSGISSLRSIDK